MKAGHKQILYLVSDQSPIVNSSNKVPQRLTYFLSEACGEVLSSESKKITACFYTHALDESAKVSVPLNEEAFRSLPEVYDSISTLRQEVRLRAF